MNWTDGIDGVLDLIDHFWIGFVMIAVAGIPSWFAARNRKQMDRNHNEAMGQIRNGHDTPLRADLDRAINSVDALGHDVRGLRQDMNSIDDLRRQQIADLRTDLDNRIEKRRRQED